jgi:hypothetical protein
MDAIAAMYNISSFESSKFDPHSPAIVQEITPLLRNTLQLSNKMRVAMNAGLCKGEGKINLDCKMHNSIGYIDSIQQLGEIWQLLIYSE